MGISSNLERDMFDTVAGIAGRKRSINYDTSVGGDVDLHGKYKTDC